MKKIFYLAAMVLCLGIAATSCKKDDTKDAEIEDLGGGIYKINGARFVDLGLPSGLLWAECNVGATSATERGNRFAWGETESKTGDYTPENYKFGTSADNYTKYSERDGKQVLEAADDAATVALGSPCRTPLSSEFKELLNSDNTTGEWTSKTTSDGKTVKGYEVKSKKNGNSVFFPALRYTPGNDQAEYWCADIYDNVPFDYELASHRLFNEIAGTLGFGGVSRYFSSEIRPVANISK